MGFETIGWMKVLAVKGIEKQGNLWAVGIPAIMAECAGCHIFLRHP